jgi:hypothetical protein
VISFSNVGKAPEDGQARPENVNNWKPVTPYGSFRHGSVAVGDELAVGVEELSPYSLAGPATVCRTVRRRSVAKRRELCVTSGSRDIAKCENPRLKA